MSNKNGAKARCSVQIELLEHKMPRRIHDADRAQKLFNQNRRRELADNAGRRRVYQGATTARKACP